MVVHLLKEEHSQPLIALLRQALEAVLALEEDQLVQVVVVVLVLQAPTLQAQLQGVGYCLS